jgi:hypothetical protein
VKPIPNPKNVVQNLRAMHSRLNDGIAFVDDAWWTSEAAAIIERLVFQRDEADASKARMVAERDETIKRMTAALEATVKHIDRLESLCRMQMEDIGRLRQGIDAWAAGSAHQSMTDEQVRKVIAAMIEAGNG